MMQKIQYELGQALYYGFYDLEENEGQALKLFEKAAEQEFAEAQQLLGDWYAEGIVVSQNYGKALDLYKRASGNGCIEATVDLEVYAEGLGVKNGKRALEHLIAAAENGIKGQTDAWFILCKCCWNKKI